MPRRQQIEGGTKNKILEVGRRMFFENGFDGTGVRAIMREVGLDVGAFDLFAPYRRDFQQIADGARQAPYLSLLRFFY